MIPDCAKAVPVECPAGTGLEAGGWHEGALDNAGRTVARAAVRSAKPKIIFSNSIREKHRVGREEEVSTLYGDQTDPVLMSIQAKTADTVWTRTEYEVLVRFLHNDNKETDFAMGWRKDRLPHYAKSKKMSAERVISWSWRTITDEVPPDKRVTFVPYSQNSQALSRWGCMDFDAHDGNGGRAKRLAFAAWQFLLNSEMTVIIEATGRGWHVWAISKDFRPIRDWTLLLRGVAKIINAPVQAGICELYPDDTGAKHGKGVRAPGSWNPSTNSANLILHENSQELLSGLTRPISKLASLSEERFTNIKSNDFSKYTAFELSLKAEHSIVESSTRHQKLLNLVGQAFHKMGLRRALKLIESQHDEATVRMRASRSEHSKEFSEMWCDLTMKWSRELSDAEQGKTAVLKTETEKDAFRIIRNFGRMALDRGDADFPIAIYNLAERLGITAPGASKLLERFISHGILKRTAYAVKLKSAARYTWNAVSTFNTV